MILVFGGTTEGRRAIEVMEEAGSTYYYSTKTGEQDVVLHHGHRTDGAMDVTRMVAFCEEHGIRVIVDAAHPFANVLHKTIAEASRRLRLPVIRFERIYPPRDPDITWIDDYTELGALLSPHTTLMATTGVQSIGKLRYLEEQGITVIYRILNRESSIRLALEQGAKPEQLCFYGDANEIPVDADAILLKESGETGGFSEKITAARARGMKVIALKRPELSGFGFQSLTIVDGSYGLRRAIERLLPKFYPLRSGLTTGTFATAAVKAAVLSLQCEEEDAVWVRLPNGESVLVDIEAVGKGEATVVKDFSDDPDVTRGCRITAKVVLHPNTSGGTVRFLQGEGVGRVTLPGLGIPVGEPAINPTPRQMMTAEVHALTEADADIIISVENGRELAERTFNGRVGVVDGISIIGTSGIVAPLSNEAFIDSIGRELQVARAIGCEAIGLASGKRGEEALLAKEPNLRVIHYGNFIGAALERAHALGFRRVVLGIMIGKAVKLAEGHLDTHSHKVLMNKKFLAEVGESVGVPDAKEKLEGITMARELLGLMPPVFFEAIRSRCLQWCRKVFPTGELEVVSVENYNG